MCCAAPPPLALRKPRWGLRSLELLGSVPLASCSSLCLPQSTLQILSLFCMYRNMKRLESNLLERSHYYNLPMSVCHQHSFPISASVIPTSLCYTLATLNYCFSNIPSLFTSQAFAYPISSVRHITLTLFQPPRQTLTILLNSVPRSHIQILF